MRFDDSLKTVLAADQGPGFGAQSAWRQIVDLLGRGRITDAEAEGAALARLAGLRSMVPVAIRAASARALALARPPAGLVAFMAADDLAIAAPVLRTARLEGEAWLDLLPRLSPAGRAVLRQRRDLPEEVVRGLESFGSVDFVLHDRAGAAATADPAAGTRLPETVATPAESAIAPPLAPASIPPVYDAAPVVDMPLSPSSFVTLGEVTRTLPLVAEALRQAEEPATPASTPRFEIADLVARIDAFQRDREEPTLAAELSPPAEGFRFETDAAGAIRWVEGASRTALVGVSIARAGRFGIVAIDPAVAAAFARRAPFVDVRMEVAGAGEVAGSWRVAGTPLFDRTTGRFSGFHVAARRPQRHESAVPEVSRQAASEGLRQLVHELRTPANAVAGFAELIETELLGPVADSYRRRAAAIRHQAAGLLSAIDDLDTAARIEGGALDLRSGTVALGDLVARLATELTPLSRERGAILTLSGEEAVAAVDDRAAERLMGRLLATLVSAASPGERIGIAVHPAGDQAVVALDRPRRLADLKGEALFSLDGLVDRDEGGPLLGAGFTLRLVRNLTAKLGGTLSIEADRLVLRLPARRDDARAHHAGEPWGR